MGGLFGLLMLRRSRIRSYRVLSIIGFSTFLLTAIIRVGVRQDWW